MLVRAYYNYFVPEAQIWEKYAYKQMQYGCTLWSDIDKLQIYLPSTGFLVILSTVVLKCVLQKWYLISIIMSCNCIATEKIT